MQSEGLLPTAEQKAETANLMRQADVLLEHALFMARGDNTKVTTMLALAIGAAVGQWSKDEPNLNSALMTTVNLARDVAQQVHMQMVKSGTKKVQGETNPEKEFLTNSEGEMEEVPDLSGHLPNE